MFISFNNYNTIITLAQEIFFRTNPKKFKRAKKGVKCIKNINLRIIIGNDLIFICFLNNI